MSEPVPSIAAAPSGCAGCGTQLAPSLLVCPVCSRLVHGQALARLAAEAEAAQQAGDAVRATALWRQALELLPEGTRQHAGVVERIAALRDAAAAGAPATPKEGGAFGGRLGGTLGALGALGLLLWKFKFVVVFVLTKGKLLLLGLTKASTVLSMALSVGVYWTLWGWKFALAFVAAMYVHEMGHVAALRRFGLAATAPMFVPGLGAFVRLGQRPADAIEDSRIGLWGPVWGLGAAAAAWGVALATGSAFWLAVTRTAAWLNLFNLLPLGSLDGGRGFRALTRRQRWWAVAAMAGMWFVTEESLFFILLAAGVFRAFGGEAPEKPDNRGLLLYVGLLVVGGLLCMVKPAISGHP